MKKIKRLKEELKKKIKPFVRRKKFGYKLKKKDINKKEKD